MIVGYLWMMSPPHPILYKNRITHKFTVSVEVLTPHGLIHHFVFFVIDLKTRKVEIAGVTHAPTAHSTRLN